MSKLTISGLARAVGVGVETVRYYQRRGLLETPRRVETGGHGGSFRHYGEHDVNRLRFIKHAQAAGFTLNQIGELIALDATEDRARAHELATERIKALDVKLAEMKAARSALVRLARECGSGSAGACPIILAFTDVGSQVQNS